MEIKANEISSLIKKEIQDFNKSTEYSKNLGTVVEVGDGIAIIYGLQDVILGELLQFKDDVFGMVMNLEEDSLSAVLLGEANKVKEGDTVKGTGKVMTVPVGEAMLGRVVDALGRPIDGKGEIKTTTRYAIERKAPSIISRESVNSPLETGIKCIDALIPIGKGQRELIIGDRQSGKTAIAVDTIINQKGKNVICIYVAIGQKTSTVAQLAKKLEEFGAMDYSIIVSATADESAPLQYIAPFAGVAIAEEFMEQGKAVLIVYDDLTKHAQAYRAMSLLLRRPPGREAYPGDVFYLHSRLLERACKLNDKLGGGSITALPIIETQAGDVSAYIPTNVISITDGQIFLETGLFNSGIRPAINAGISVSRVGGAAQTKAIKQVAGKLRLDLAQFRELEAFAQFASDLDKATQDQLLRGQKLTEVLKQPQYSPLSVAQQVSILFAANEGVLDDVPNTKIAQFKKEWFDYFDSNLSDLSSRLNAGAALSDEDKAVLKERLENFKSSVFSA